MTPAEGPDSAVLMGQSMVSLMEMMEPLDWVTYGSTLMPNPSMEERKLFTYFFMTGPR